MKGASPSLLSGSKEDSDCRISHIGFPAFSWQYPYFVCKRGLFQGRMQRTRKKSIHCNHHISTLTASKPETGHIIYSKYYVRALLMIHRLPVSTGRAVDRFENVYLLKNVNITFGETCNNLIAGQIVDYGSDFDLIERLSISEVKRSYSAPDLLNSYMRL